MMGVDVLALFLETSIGESLNPIDIQLARLMNQLESDSWVAICAGLTSHELGKGNVCFDLRQANDLYASDFFKTHVMKNKPANALHALQKILSASPLIQALNNTKESSADAPSASFIENPRKPLVLDGFRLYLQRYWWYEVQLSQLLHDRLQPMAWPELPLREYIAEMFPHVSSSQLDGDPSNPHLLAASSTSEVDWQAVAVTVAASQKFSVISGGPGTGKTTTVIRLLAVLAKLYLNKNHRTPIVQLAAPTGKAAMRLSESIKGAKQKINLAQDVNDAVPEEASTLHRLLRLRRDGTYQYHPRNPLHLDVLVIDEASMVDLPMMYKLFSALPSHAQVILLGDKDQLASVEAGSILADICNSQSSMGYSPRNTELIQKCLNTVLPAEYHQHEGAAIRDHLCHLYKSYRFDENSGIGFLAKAANQGNIRAWKSTLAQPFSDIEVSDLTEANFARFLEQTVEGYQYYLESMHQNRLSENGISDQQAIEIHTKFSHYQVLCGVREGAMGVSGLNHNIEAMLIAAHLIADERHFSESRSTDRTITQPSFSSSLHNTEPNPIAQWYAGRPIMVMENDYSLELFNGDIGIALPVKRLASSHQELMVSFVTADGKIRWIKPTRLPKHETVYAMTVHKSQGSEFEHCVLVLPDKNVGVLTKELIYTGITRAKKRLQILGHADLIEKGLRRPVKRASGLKDRLWGAGHAAESPANIDIESSIAGTNNRNVYENETDQDDTANKTGQQFNLF